MRSEEEIRGMYLADTDDFGATEQRRLEKARIEGYNMAISAVLSGSQKKGCGKQINDRPYTCECISVEREFLLKLVDIIQADKAIVDTIWYDDYTTLLEKVYDLIPPAPEVK